MSLTACERETLVSMNDGDNVAYIYSAQRTVITRLRKNPAATLIEEGSHEGSVWARFTLPAYLVSFRSVRRTPTEEERRRFAERMAALRHSAPLRSETPPGAEEN